MKFTDAVQFPGSRKGTFATRRRGLLLLVGGWALLGATGCAVPQPRGEGKLEYITEPTSQRGYYLYLPEAYLKGNDAAKAARRWPMVVTFHGMKPFDSAPAQAAEWQQEADRFGFIVVAPVLRAPDVLNQFPLREITPELKEDENATLAILRHVGTNTKADTKNVLATSWSSGGYMAHYMLNRHPNQFSALGVRQSNFSSAILDASMTSKSEAHPILIVNTENDFSVCVKESSEAVHWYESHRYRFVAWVKIKDLGHERTPETAADFFARVAGVQPMRPQDALARRQAIDGNPTGLALLAGNSGQIQSPARKVGPGADTPTMLANPPTPTRTTAVSAKPIKSDFVTVERKPQAQMTAPPAAQASVPVSPDTAVAAKPSKVLSIWASSVIGTNPLTFNFAAECPPDWERTADFHWTMNGKPLGTGARGVTTISDPGEFALGLLVVTADGKEYRASRLVRVVSRSESASVRR